MTFAFKAAGEWIEIVGDTLVPGFGEPDADDVRDASLVSEAFVASLPPNVRAARGLVEVVKADRPVGVNITGSVVADVAGVPTRQYTHAALDSDALATLIARQHSRIDGEASQVISAALPLWKQMNMNARGTELLDLASQRALTSDEQAERTTLRAAWAWVRAVRDHSDALKAALPSDGPGAAAFDITAGWPSPPI